VKVVVGREMLRTWEFTELGFGVGLVVRVS